MQEPNRDLMPVAASATVATMQREVNEPQAANRSARQAIQESKAVLEPLARLGAILLGATYLAGFLIVMQHHATFGIVDVGLLRARVMAAGVLFDFLTLLPVVVVSRVYGWLGLSALGGGGLSTLSSYLRTRDEDRVFREIILATSMFVACASLAGAVSALFTVGVQRQNFWFMLGLIPIFITSFLTRKYSFDHVRKVTALAVASTIILGWSMTMLGGLDSLWRSLWFFGCAMPCVSFRQPSGVADGGRSNMN